jgi:serine/threonine protein kinase/formylglycine-generating enzyme required for sulfatase activity
MPLAAGQTKLITSRITMAMNERVLFEAALEIADPEARKVFLDKACQGDADLRVSIEALLKSHDTAGSFLEIPAVDHLDAASAGRTARTVVSSSKGENDESDDESVDLSFLQPSGKAGSIGTLGHYEILAILGQGGFGIVFKAFDEKLHRLVAIKVMSPQMAATSPPRKRFLREARSAAAIKHENIVQVYSVEEHPLPYLVMEYIDGETLGHKLDASGPLETAEVLYIGRQLAAGLAAAHAMGLVHRDIKPGNILLEKGPEQKVKIADFGLARATDDASLTRSGMICGTPLYMAPEQALGQPLDHRTDLFSLGSVLYQIACGRPPFRAPTAIAVLRRVAEDTPRALQEIVPEIPDWLVAIINKLLAKKPEDRFQTAREVADLFARCQSELQLTGRVTSVALPSSAPLQKRAVITGPPTGNPSGSFGVVSDQNSRAETSKDAGARSGQRHIGAPDKRKTRSSGRRAMLVVSGIFLTLSGILLLAIGAWLYPSLSLIWGGRASFKNLTRDGDTHIEFLRNGEVVSEQYGYGTIELPAGQYDFRLTNPDPTLKVYNSVIRHRKWMLTTDQVTLESLPQTVHLSAGEQIEFMVAYTRASVAAVASVDEPIDGQSDPLAELPAAFTWPVNAPLPAIAPFDAGQARQHQEAWARYLDVPVEFADEFGTKFILIPPGEFLMGSSQQESEKLSRELKQAGANDFDQFVATSSSPQHAVRITRPWFASAHEICVAEFRRFIENSNYLTTAEQLGVNRQKWTESATGELPEQRAVIGVSWDDAAAYCAWRSARDGVTCQLPTEAQWEFACRAGTTTLWSFGDDPGQLAEFAVFQRPSFWPAEVVGTKKPNPFGLYDMHGNADEWCLDWHSSGFYAQAPINDPVMLDNPQDANSGRVARGGSSHSVAWWTRSATRPWDFPATPTNPKGFRIVITGDLKTAIPASVGWQGWPATAPQPQ